jgi:hypothetical protein
MFSLASQKAMFVYGEHQGVYLLNFGGAFDLLGGKKMLIYIPFLTKVEKCSTRGVMIR